MKAKFEEQIVQLGGIIANLEEEQRHMGQGLSIENSIFAQFRKHSNLQQLDRTLLIELVDTIYIHESKEISIVFKFADEFEQAMEFVEMNLPKETAAV